MTSLLLHNEHEAMGARFAQVNGSEVVEHYGDALAEYHALHRSAAVLDLSFRDRLSVQGSDRERLLNGQVTNNIKALREGEGCYAAVTTSKGKMVADANIYRLATEYLLDLEPGVGDRVRERLEKYIVADDVAIQDAAPNYLLFSLQGPQSATIVTTLLPDVPTPDRPFRFVAVAHTDFGEIYLVNQARVGSSGYDLFVPDGAGPEAWRRMVEIARQHEAMPCGWRALEVGRVEAGIPRFGADMDDTNLPPEAGIEDRAISYSKGCYTGQEVIARLRTYGQVARTLRGLQLSDEITELPPGGSLLLKDKKEVGYLTSAIRSPNLNANLALGYVRRECNQIGTELIVKTDGAESPARIVPLPFGGD